jgi:chromosome segregation ATPase
MLDALKSFTSGNKAQKEYYDLQGLIASAREEREALSVMLTQLSTRGSKLLQMGKSIEQVEHRATAAGMKLDEVGRRIDGLEQRSRTFVEVEKRVQGLIEAATGAQQAAQKMLGPDSELQAHRRHVQQLSSQALETHSNVDALRKEVAALDEFRAKLRSAQSEIKQSVEAAGVLRGELDQVRGTSTQLSQDYATLRDLSRAAREESTVAIEGVKDVEKRLVPLMQLQDLSKATEEKLTALNALAEHVNQKAKALDGQKHIVDRAVVEANRLNEMIWSMDVQINKLTEGMKQAAKAEETVATIEKLVDEANGKAQAATILRDEFGRDAARFEKEGRALIEAMRTQTEALSLGKKQFEAFDERLKTFQGTVGEAEVRMDAMAVKEKHVAQMTQRVDALGKDFQALSAQADDLSRKQAAFDSLQAELSQLNELSKRTASQYASLTQSRADLETLRKEIHDFHKSHAEVAQLRGKLGADRAALESFGERLTSFRARTPELEATMDALLGKLARVDEGARQATRIGELSADLEEQLTRVSARIQFVDKVEGRLNTLHVLNADVERKLADQLARRSELDTLKAQTDGVVAQALDAQHQLDAVAALQKKLTPMINHVEALQDQLDKAAARFRDVQREDVALTQQAATLAELAEQSRTFAAETAQRIKQTQSIGEELQRSSAAKDELFEELVRLQQRQREVVAQVDAAEDQIKRAESICTTLEQRRTQLVFSERKMSGIEAKLGELVQQSADLDAKVKFVSDREAVVAAVKAEVDNVHQIAARSKADLLYVADHREDLAVVTRQVQDLLGKAVETDDKIAQIEARRKMVDEVQAKTSLISNLLEDVRVNLEALGEHKAVIDHVAEKLASLEFVAQEAQNTLRTLQHERELAERIEKSIKLLRTRTAPSADKPEAATA